MVTMFGRWLGKNKCLLLHDWPWVLNCPVSDNDIMWHVDRDTRKSFLIRQTSLSDSGTVCTYVHTHLRQKIHQIYSTTTITTTTQTSEIQRSDFSPHKKSKPEMNVRDFPPFVNISLFSCPSSSRSSIHQRSKTSHQAVSNLPAALQKKPNTQTFFFRSSSLSLSLSLSLKPSTPYLLHIHLPRTIFPIFESALHGKSKNTHARTHKHQMCM